MAILNFFDILALQPNFFNDAEIDDRIDKEVLKNAILRRCGTLLPLYTNSEMFKIFSDNYFHEKKDIIRKLIDTTEFQYNPIENYDRKEEVNREESLSAGIGTSVVSTPNTTQTVVGSNEETIEGSNEETIEGTNNTNAENKISAYDSTTYQTKDKTETLIEENRERTGTEKRERAGTENSTITNSGTVKTDTTQNGTDTTTENISTRTHGNIGITTTQSLIAQERKVAMFNIYNWIAIEFEQNFFICVS